jgi:hypothetical protein
VTANVKPTLTEEKHEETFCPARASWSGLSLTRAVSTRAFDQTRDYVYVETDIKTPNGNSIAGFVRGANGQLQPIPGSPFLMGRSGHAVCRCRPGPVGFRSKHHYQPGPDIALCRILDLTPLQSFTLGRMVH